MASLFLLSACADPNYSKVPPTLTTSAPEAPPAEKLEPYKVQIGDVLDVNLYLNPELNETATVRPDGMISTRIVEDLYVYNKTPSQITSMLKKSYKRILSDPSMTTVVRSFAPIRIYVSGEVVTPGEYLVVGEPLTLTQAIARAGGIKNSGMQDKVLIIRRGAQARKGACSLPTTTAPRRGRTRIKMRVSRPSMSFSFPYPASRWDTRNINRMCSNSSTLLLAPV